MHFVAPVFKSNLIPFTIIGVEANPNITTTNNVAMFLDLHIVGMIMGVN